MRAYPAAEPSQEMRSPRLESGLTASLGEALATKLVGVLRGRHHHFLAKRHGFTAPAELFLAHSKLEQAHADSLAERIVELESEPTFAPESLLIRGLAGHFSPSTQALDMAQDELDAARASATLLAGAAQLAGTEDLATRRLVMSILDADHQRAKELSSLVTTLKGKRTSTARATA